MYPRILHQNDGANFHAFCLQLAVFLNKYRAHCEEVLQLVLRAEFVRVEHLLFQFWPRERDSLVLLLNAHPVLNVIRLCDHLFFKTMISASFLQQRDVMPAL